MLRFNTYLKLRPSSKTLADQKPVKKIAFFPQPSGPWYSAWLAVHMLNLEIVEDRLLADHVFVFDDKTVSNAGATLDLGLRLKAINADIGDISKTHVGAVFKDVLGYSVDIDPLSHKGPAVEKSDGNGTHDGRVIQCPIKPNEMRSDCVYQKLIDSTPTGEFSEDLRLAYVGGEISLVYHKFKHLDKRFGTDYARVDVCSPQNVFSEEEIDALCKFCDAMGLEFGAVDIMRDKHDGRIYAVDVNKTCMPVLCLSLKSQVAAFKKIAASLENLLDRKASEPQLD